MLLSPYLVSNLFVWVLELKISSLGLRQEDKRNQLVLEQHGVKKVDILLCLLFLTEYSNYLLSSLNFPKIVKDRVPLQSSSSSSSRVYVTET